MIKRYILSKRFFLKCEELSDARAVPITKTEYDLQYTFYKDQKSLES